MIEVAAGILTDHAGRVLLMQRLPGKHLAGLWEFPGGKLEPGESVAAALARELAEELGIEVLASAPLISLPWHYPEKAVRLHALRVTDWRGEPRAREGHPLRWMPLPEVDVACMPPADVPIVAALRLPPHYVIADVADALPRSLASDSGALWQLRLPGASRAAVRQAVERTLAAVPRLRGRLLLNHDVELARELGVGVHLKAAQLHDLHARPLPAGVWVGASCHNAAELDLAARLGADFATLSPVQATVSHPAAAALGWAHFARLVVAAKLPVYALGGMRPSDLAHAQAAGAQGVAGIRAFRGLA